MADCKPIEACKLTKCYGDFEAVKGVDFEVSRGECVALLGPNGAGKTTTIRMLTCFSPITDGVIRVFGHDVSEHPRLAKSMMGICPQEDNLDPDFTVQNNLLVFARYFGIEKSIAASRVDQLLKKVGLTEKADSSIIELSGGMKRRLMIARALLNEPRLLVMDEPTTGLHQHDIKKLLEILHTFVATGNTVVVIEHNLDVIKTADHIIDMGPDGGVKGGNIIAEGKPEEIIKIKASYTGQFLKEMLENKIKKIA